MLRLACAALIALSGMTSIARAADEGQPAEAAPSPPAAMPPPAAAMPPPAESGANPPPAGGTALTRPGMTAGELVDDAGATRPADLSYGVGARLRWVTVPAWMLNLFTKRNVPLSSWGTGIEFFRRKANFDFVASLSYQNMSPPDGNWLGKGHDAMIDTDYVQFDKLALWGADVSFIWHTMFNEWFGMHYGAGIGVGIVQGRIWRTSNAGCTEDNAGNLIDCHPQGATCTSESCTLPPAVLAPGPDSVTNPHRFSDENVPPVLPIVNVVVGVNFRLPQVRGWEGKIEGGFYNAFFLGGGVGYSF
jgi:hypothetical protein